MCGFDLGKHSANAGGSSTSTLLVDPATNTAGLILTTAVVFVDAGSKHIVVGTSLATAVPVLGVFTSITADTNHDSRKSVVLPMPIRIQPGLGLWLFSDSAGGSASITYDLLS